MRGIRGITLMALVITIILLLILAGVVLNLTLGENGILKMAEHAVEKNSEESAREKLEIALLYLQACKNSDNEYNENDYIDNYLERQGLSIDGNIVYVDGWKFEIDRTTPKIGQGLGKGELESITITTPYVGTSSFTIRIESAYKEEDIESYTYKIDDVEVKTIGEKEYTTENEIAPESIHNIQVIGNYKSGKTLESNKITIKTEPRVYLYNSGNEYESYTGGWIGKSIRGYGQSNGQYSKTTEYLYVKNISTNPAISSNYYPSWVTSKQMDFSKYRKIVAEGEFIAPTGTSTHFIINSSENFDGTQYIKSNGSNTVNKHEIFLDNIDKGKLYYVAVCCQNSNNNNHTEIKLRKLWLEK